LQSERLRKNYVILENSKVINGQLINKKNKKIGKNHDLETPIESCRFLARRKTLLFFPQQHLHQAYGLSGTRMSQSVGAHFLYEEFPMQWKKPGFLNSENDENEKHT
jgi:hypothetical protein